MDSVLRKFVVLPYSEYVRQQATIKKQFDLPPPPPRSNVPPSANIFVPTPSDMNTINGGCSGEVYVDALQAAKQSKDGLEPSTSTRPPPPQADPSPLETQPEVLAHIESRETAESAEAVSQREKGVAVDSIVGQGSESTKSDKKKKKLPVGKDSKPVKERKSTRKRTLHREPDTVYWLTG